MKNFLLALSFVYGIGVSTVSSYYLFIADLPQLDYAVRVGAKDAEMRHRINVATDGTWVLLGNIISVIALAGFNRRQKDS